MKQFTTAAVAVAALLSGSQAQATLLFSANIDGVPVIRCADNAVSSALCPGGDQDPALGTLQLANGTFAGVTLNGSVSTSQGTVLTPGSPNILNTSSLNIINTTGATVHIQAAAGDTDFTPPVGEFNASTSGTFQQAIGSSITTSFFNDPGNSQGAEDPLDLPGLMIASFADSATLIADAYSHTSGGPVSDLVAFGMTQGIDLFLVANGQLVNRGATELKTPVVPEPTTLMILSSGLLAGWWAMRRVRSVSRTQRA